jgi:L-lactate dehydrogenase
LRLFDTNAEIYRDIVPRIVRAAPRVLNTGTFLDSLRFRVHLAEHFDVDANQVEAQVIGEHGVSQVFLWSAVRIAGMPIGKLIQARGESLDGLRKKIEDSVRYANITIIEGNDASQFGMGIVAARITEMVLRDERAVVPIGSFNKNFGVTLSLPWSDAEASSGVRAGDVRRGAAGARGARRQLEEIGEPNLSH